MKYFERIYIKSKSDLPPMGTYHCETKDGPKFIGCYPESKIYQQTHDYWLKNVDWYFKPVDVDIENLERRVAAIEKEKEEQIKSFLKVYGEEINSLSHT